MGLLKGSWTWHKSKQQVWCQNPRRGIRSIDLLGHAHVEHDLYMYLYMLKVLHIFVCMMQKKNIYTHYISPGFDGVHLGILINHIKLP